MRRLEPLILQARRDTENSDFTDSTGISDDDFIEYANRGQERIQSLIATRTPALYIREITFSTVARQESYTIPAEAYLATRIVMVEHSQGGNERDYIKLKQAQLQERLNGIYGTPSFYIRRNNEILLQPIPEVGSGRVRLNYQYQLPTLDKRRAAIASVTTTGSGITSLVLDTTQEIDRSALLDQNYFCVVDKFGAQTMQAVPVLDINEASGVVTLDTFSFAAGESIAAGNYLVAGKNAENRSGLADICERYIVQYMIFRAFKRDSNQDSGEADKELKELEDDILANYSEPDNDIDYVTILDGQYLDNDLD